MGTSICIALTRCYPGFTYSLAEAKFYLSIFFSAAEALSSNTTRLYEKAEPFTGLLISDHRAGHPLLRKIS